MANEIACDQPRTIESELYTRLPLYMVVSAEGDILEPLRSQNGDTQDGGVSVFTEQALATAALKSWSRENAKVQEFTTRREFRSILWIITQFIDLKWIAVDPRADDSNTAHWLQIESILAINARSPEHNRGITSDEAESLQRRFA